MNKNQLQELVQECIAEVLDERFTNEGYDEFQRADKGSKGVAAKDKAEEDTYGAGYAAGEKAAKAKYKKLAEAYKALKETSQHIDEEGFGIGPRGLEVNDGGKERQINEVDMQEILPALIASGLLSVGAISAIKQAIKDPKKFVDDVKKQGKLPNKLG
jgi:hypothetical protein